MRVWWVAAGPSQATTAGSAWRLGSGLVEGDFSADRNRVTNVTVFGTSTCLSGVVTSMCRPRLPVEKGPDGQATETADQAAATALYSALPLP
jgi:hypothetical protein